MKKSVYRLSLLALFAVLVAAPLAAATPAPAPAAVACAAPAVESLDLDALLADANQTPAEIEGQSPLFLSCSGDNCGCYDPPCSTQCDPGDWPCMNACRREQVQCAICCCTPAEFQPPYC